MYKTKECMQWKEANVWIPKAYTNGWPVLGEKGFLQDSSHLLSPVAKPTTPNTSIFFQGLYFLH